MTTIGWMKDVLLFCVVLSTAGAIAAFLLATDRVEHPTSFEHPSPKFDNVNKIANRLDMAILANLAQHDLTVAPKANTSQVVRRLSMALTGTLPSVEELRQLASVKENDRRPVVCFTSS